LASEPATTPAAASDLISFLKALVAILSIPSGQGSLVGMERYS
jgi:hypothetical protein